MRRYRGVRGRRYPVGAEVLPEGADFRIWAPEAEGVEVALLGRGRPSYKDLSPEGNGYFSGRIPEAGDGSMYKYRLNGGGDLLPDPVSRYQPEGVLGPSMIVDHSAYPWKARSWKGPNIRDLIFYELHIGTFTHEGTWTAAANDLERLSDFGINAIEVMPIAEFAGRWGWGYDGVDLYAPYHVYGTPDEMRSFVDRAHSMGISVFLDVVYNHIGSSGSFLGRFSKHYSAIRNTDWGSAFNYDQDLNAPVREFVSYNALFWLDEYKLDGLRLDATQDIIDSSKRHIIAELTDLIRERISGRKVLIVAENEPEDSILLTPTAEGGYGCDMAWNDDLHHSSIPVLTGTREAYFMDYRGSAMELLSCAKRGYLFQGQHFYWQHKRRGKWAPWVERFRLVAYLQNHDQIANAVFGRRYKQISSPALYRAMTAYLLLVPMTPLLFQGQEFASSKDWVFFSDMPEDLHDAVKFGRRQYLGQFRSAKEGLSSDLVPDPLSRETFERCKLDRSEIERNGPDVALFRDLLRIRREDAVFSALDKSVVDGAVLNDRAFVVRYSSQQGLERLLIFNLGPQLDFAPCPEPLLSPPKGGWAGLWCSEDPSYGGSGAFPPEDEDGRWSLQGFSASVLGGKGE